MKFFAELTRRKVFKVGGAYLVVAWLAVQAASIGFPAFDAPPWALRIFILVALLGFPIALVFAWAFEITPNGVKPESGSRSTRAILLIAAVLTALAFAWYFKGQPSYRADTLPPNADAAKQASANAAIVAAPVSRKSIAVLPFTDLSPSHDQEYFSDGMAEELLNALAKVKDLKVAGRTSSFSFKGKNEDLRTIGKTLSVANILEGSVRKQGDKVRITAQLIRTDNDFHLWSESYDGDMSDVFALQERIARAITDQLKVVLQGDQNIRLVPVATTNPEAYALYLQATGIFNRREGARFPDAMTLLEQALKLDPKFARAHSRLAVIAAIAPTYMMLDWNAATAIVEEHARKAIELDPTLAEPYAAQGQVYTGQRRLLEARPQFERALALDPDDTSAAFWYATDMIMSGYPRQGYKIIDRVLDVDPMLPTALLWRGIGYVYDGDDVDAERLLQRAADAKLAFAGLGLSFVADAHHRQAEAIEQLAAAFKALRTGLPAQSTDLLARGILGDEPARLAALTMIDDYLKTKPAPVSGFVIYGLMRMHEPARALAVAQDAPSSNDAGFMSLLWSPYGHEARVLPQFSEFARKAGLTAVWDRYGAPDYCHKRALGDYACE
jgi:TolB-like protein/Tfp pilus assembly protein PilF